MLFNVPHSSPHLPDHSVKLYDIKIIEFNISAEAAKLIILDRWAAARAGVTMPGISSSDHTSLDHTSLDRTSSHTSSLMISKVFQHVGGGRGLPCGLHLALGKARAAGHR